MITIEIRIIVLKLYIIVAAPQCCCIYRKNCKSLFNKLNFFISLVIVVIQINSFSDYLPSAMFSLKLPYSGRRGDKQ